MINALDVYLWGTRIGSAYCRPGHPIVQFEYSDEIRADMGYAYNPAGDWTSRHQMSVNGRRIGIEDEDLVLCATRGNIASRRAKSVLAEVRAAVMDWPRFAAEAEVREEFAEKIWRLLQRVI